MSAKLYLEIDGKEYRVHDTRYAGGKHIRVALGDAAAMYRMFIPREPEPLHRSYAFKKGESHALTESDLERQFRNAGFAPKHPPPPGITDPR